MAIETFRTIALGEFMPYHWVTDPISDLLASDEDLDETSADGTSTDEADSGTGGNVLKNMGVMLAVSLVITLIAIIIVLLVKFCKKGSKAHNLLLKVKKKIMWNSVLRAILQSYLKTVLGITFAVKAVNFDTSTDSVNGVLSIVLFAVMVAMPIFFALLLHKNRASLATDEMKEKIGSIYLGIRTETVWHRLYSTVFLSRRLVYAIMTISCI